MVGTRNAHLDLSAFTFNDIGSLSYSSGLVTRLDAVVKNYHHHHIINTCFYWIVLFKINLLDKILNVKSQL